MYLCNAGMEIDGSLHRISVRTIRMPMPEYMLPRFEILPEDRNLPHHAILQYFQSRYYISRVKTGKCRRS